MYILHQYNSIVTTNNYINYMKSIMKILSLFIASIYFNNFILFWVMLYLIDKTSRVNPKLGIVEGKKAIYIFVQYNDYWLNAKIISLQKFSSTMIMQIKIDANNLSYTHKYTYMIFAYKIPKDIYLLLSRNVHCYMQYNQISEVKS